ncbi:MAG TPA: hypothetical protein VLV55_13140 [Rhizomicrobium sp.]|nr:hypothetical protein [Rhizomicrobium sp.]
MRRILLLLALCGAVALSACLPVTSKVPAGSTVGFRPDPTLQGSWIGRGVDDKDNNPAYMHFLANEDGTMTAILVSDSMKDHSGEWSQYTLRAALLGATHVLSVQEVSNNGTPSTDSMAQQFILMSYREGRGGTVTLMLMDDKAAAAAVKAGEIAGTVDPGEDGDVHITADAKALDKFLASSRGAALFSKPLVTMKRLEIK